MDNPSTTPNPYGNAPTGHTKRLATWLMAVIAVVLLITMFLLLAPTDRRNQPQPRTLPHNAAQA